MKVVGMIPARLGSKRVPKKNLRLLGGKPMISYMIQAAQKSGVLNEIYLNSESEVFGQIAREQGIKFYKRPEALSSDKTINDEFVVDFINNVEADILVQLVPTSPLITANEIQGFVKHMTDGKYDTLVSVVDHQIACLYQEKAINFSTWEPHKSSQEMTAVQSYACVLMAWTYASLRKNLKRHGCVYHGGSGKIGYYPLKGLSTIDIDNEEDFILAEVALQYRESGQGARPKEYYEPVQESKKL